MFGRIQFVAKIHTIISLVFCLCFFVADVAFSASSSGTNAPPAPLARSLRLIGPVRFSHIQSKAAQSVPEARAILTKFQKAGYSPAIWAVGALPVGTNAIKEWVTTCLAAFPEPPVLALDPALFSDEAGDNTVSGALVYDLDPSLNRKSGYQHVRETLAPFLLTASSLDVFMPLVLKHVHSVMINYTHLNNLACQTRPAPAIALAQENAVLVRNAAQAAGRPVFLWLQVDDGQAAAAGIGEWVEKLGPLVDGIELHSWHEWNAGQRAEYAQLPEVVKQTGKPVLRGGFRYVAPRMRPGIEKDLMDMFKERNKTYEEWVKKMGFAGYEREIGAFIPGEVSPTMTLLPE